MRTMLFYHNSNDSAENKDHNETYLILPTLEYDSASKNLFLTKPNRFFLVLYMCDVVQLQV